MKWFIIAFGILIAISTIPFGDMLHDKAAIEFLSETAEYAGFAILATFFGLILTIVGGILCCASTIEIVAGRFINFHNQNAITLASVGGLVFLTVVYAILQGPIVPDGMNIIGMWTWIPLVGFFPILLILGEAFTNTNKKKRNTP